MEAYREINCNKDNCFERFDFSYMTIPNTMTSKCFCILQACVYICIIIAYREINCNKDHKKAYEAKTWLHTNHDFSEKL